jgi:tRNA nucleotidyltransferase (CCA-adding enzyme)
LGRGDSKDYDWEIFGLPPEQVQQILSQFGNVEEVGKQFGVLSVQRLGWDVALPRREKKTGEGHKGFDVTPDPTMSIEEAARRRDFTINSMSMDPLNGEVIDPLGGVEDIKNGVLRAADPNTFSDDPLRALRAAQFAARFEFEVEPQTLQLVAAQPLEQLPGERIFTEFQKMLLKGKKPSQGIEVLRKANLLRYFPEIEALQGVPQDKEHHPEGDVYIHTNMVLDEAARQRTGDPAFDMPLMFGALCHDFGKPEFTQDEGEGKVKSLGHEEGGEAPAREFMNRMKAPKDLTNQVSTLVSTHLRPVLMAERAKGGGYRRLARVLEGAGVSFELLTAVSKADTLGRTTEKAMRRDTNLQDKFMQEANDYVLNSPSYKQNKLEDTVKGRDLIQMGFKPGPEMGKFLKLTRDIEDETGLKDANKIIELAKKFVEHMSDADKGKLDCGDSHIRPGEECYDGKYDEMRKKGITESTQGPSGFKENPEYDEADRALWHDFDWPQKSGTRTHHPGLASVTAEPAREHKRSLKFQPRWFDTGTKWSERHTEPGEKGARDGFGGSLPYGGSENPMAPPEGPPVDEDQWTGVTPEPDATRRTASDDEMPKGQPAEFPVMHPPGNKMPGFFPWDEPPNQLLTAPDPHPSPMRGGSEPGFQRHPGGGGLDRAPMIRPQGKPKPSGFLPVVNLPGPQLKADLDSNYDQHELELGIKHEEGDDETAMKKAERNLNTDPHYYTKRHLGEEISNKEKNQINVGPSESVKGEVPLGPGSHSYKNRTGKGFDKSREKIDYDYTGKKPGFLSMDLPREVNEDVSESARTIEELMRIETVFPKDYNPEWGGGGPTIGPSTKHRNERKTHDMGHDPFPGADGSPKEKYLLKSDNDMLQKQVQPLIPNQKLAIAIDPKGEQGNRIVMMSPLFPDVSPAIQALRSQRFEKHGAVVVDGPPMWLMGLEGVLQGLDKGTAHESTDQLFQKVVDLCMQKGLSIDYTQDPRP